MPLNFFPAPKLCLGRTKPLEQVFIGYNNSLAQAVNTTLPKGV